MFFCLQLCVLLKFDKNIQQKLNINASLHEQNKIVRKEIPTKKTKNKKKGLGKRNKVSKTNQNDINKILNFKHADPIPYGNQDTNANEIHIRSITNIHICAVIEKQIYCNNLI